MYNLFKLGKHKYTKKKDKKTILNPKTKILKKLIMSKIIINLLNI
jgi:hypothetical protein